VPTHEIVRRAGGFGSHATELVGERDVVFEPHLYPDLKRAGLAVSFAHFIFLGPDETREIAPLSAIITCWILPPKWLITAVSHFSFAAMARAVEQRWGPIDNEHP
jgi:hypothetical protein